MGEALNILPYVSKGLDLVTPMEVALRLRQERKDSEANRALTAQNAQTQRMFAENEATRMAAKDKREQQEFEARQKDDQRKQDIEQATAVGTIGSLVHTNPGAAMALGHAYGIDVNPLLATTSAAAPPSPPESVDSVLAADHASSPPADTGPAGYPKPEEPVYEGPAETEDLEAARMAKPTKDLESLMTRSVPPSTFEGSAETAPKPEAPSNPLYEAVIGGKHYPLPARAAGTGLGDKYDALYNHAINNLGMSDKEARAEVLKAFNADNAASNISSRTAADIAARAAEKEKHDREFVPTAEVKQKNFGTLEAGRNSRNEANNRARIEAAKLGAGPKQEQADTGKRAQYLGAVKEAKAAAGANKDIEATKRIDQVLGEMGPGSSSAAQTAALDTVTGLSQGGKAGMGMLKVLNEHVVGSILDKGADWGYQQTHHGEHSPQWKKSFNNLVDSLKEARKNDRQRDIQAFHHAAGLGSQYANDPELAPYVKNETTAFGKELGIPEGEMPSNEPSNADKLGDLMKQLRGMK